MEKRILIFSIFIAGLCSIVYELLISTTSSYFMGDSIKQFSITIGLYMAAMGLGSYLSRLLNKRLLLRFIQVEIILGLLGGLSVPLLYLAYAYTDVYYPSMLLLIISIGTLTGLEVPLLTRLLEDYDELKINLSNVLALDYFGALLATLLFPFLILPFLGTFTASLFFGLLNMSLGFINLWIFADQIGFRRRRSQWWAVALSSGTLALVLFFSNSLLEDFSSDLYEDRIVFSKQTPYQKLVMTRYKDDLRLFINGNLQFSAIDEYRYHEALVHIPMSLAPRPRRVLLLGAGDGLALREVLKYPSVEEVYLVDLDPAMTKLGKEYHYLRNLNGGSLESDKLRIFHEDAFVFLERDSSLYDVIIGDLPDPNNAALARLYSRSFFQLARQHLSAMGVLVHQSTSPFYANSAFWSIHATMKAAGFAEVWPYHIYVPSFGEWGFNLASKSKGFRPKEVQLGVTTRYLTEELVPSLFLFGKDMLPKQKPAVSTLNQPIVLEKYTKEWQYWN